MDSKTHKPFNNLQTFKALRGSAATPKASAGRG